MSKEVRTYTKDGGKILVSHEPQKGVVGGICRNPLGEALAQTFEINFDEIADLERAKGDTPILRKLKE